RFGRTRSALSLPGCDRPADWCDCHHVVHVEDGGPTCPSNCCLLCRRHHVRLHKPGWSATLDGDATLVVTDPSGRVFTSEAPIRHPRPPPELFADTG
ncbi:MAG: HNH endonuclease, partial [Actinomycetota bacterium]|nr:HNH endonuclease [Actinomycetota bacterium]